MSTGQEVQAFSLCCAKVRGKKQNAFYPDERPVHTLDDLLKIAQLDHTPGFFKDAHRGKLSWYWQECIVLDVDNTDGGKVTNPADIARDFPGVGHYIIYSRHHNKPKVKDDGKGEYPAAPRFHVYFPITHNLRVPKLNAFMRKYAFVNETSLLTPLLTNSRPTGLAGTASLWWCVVLWCVVLF